MAEMVNGQMSEAQFIETVRDVTDKSLGMLSDSINSLCEKEEVELEDIARLLNIPIEELEDVCNGGRGADISLDTYFKLCVAFIGAPKNPMGDSRMVSRNQDFMAHDKSFEKLDESFFDENEDDEECDDIEESNNSYCDAIVEKIKTPNRVPLRDERGRFIKRSVQNQEPSKANNVVVDSKRNGIISQLKKNSWDREIDIERSTTSDLERFLIGKLDSIRNNNNPKLDDDVENSRYSLSRILSRYR